MKQQDNLLLYVNKQNSSLKTENQKLSDALVKLQGVKEGSLRRELTAGAGGILVGVILVLMVQGHR